MLEIFKTIVGQRQLIHQITKREIAGRYKGSVLGLAWSFFNPVLMLIVYTFVFSVIFQTKWGQGTGGKGEFASMLFCGLIVANLFGEVVGRAPLLISSNVNYVKKVVFPLEILPVISIATALFHAFISVLVLVIALLFLNGTVPWTVILFPVVLLPFLIVLCGISWVLASLGVYLRDIGQIIGVVVTIMTFMAPVFYPLNAIPGKYVQFIMLNPLTMIIEQFRDVVVRGALISLTDWVIYLVIALVIFYIGYIFFQKTKKGFADVV